MSLAVVLDCLAYVQAIVSDRGPAFAILERVEAGLIELVVSPPILADVRELLARPKLRKLFRSLTDEKAEAYLRKVASIATVVTDILPLATLPSHPDEEPYLNLALTVGVPYLIGRQAGLLDLMDNVVFRSEYPGLTILDPVAFLKRPEVK